MTETTHGPVITLDALHCQKQTTTLITNKNDCVILLKRNQKKLFKAVEISENKLALSESKTVDISHGRQIVRKVSVFNIEPLKAADFDVSQWGLIRSLVKVETSDTPAKKDYEHFACYIIPNPVIISNF